MSNRAPLSLEQIQIYTKSKGRDSPRRKKKSIREYRAKNYISNRLSITSTRAALCLNFNFFIYVLVHFASFTFNIIPSLHSHTARHTIKRSCSRSKATARLPKWKEKKVNLLFSLKRFVHRASCASEESLRAPK